MACPCSWTILFIGFISVAFSQDNKKALLATTRYSRELHAYHGDPSTFTQDRVINDDAQMDFSFYSRVVSITPNTVDKSLLVLDLYDSTIYNYGNFSLSLNNYTGKPDIVHSGVSYTYSHVAYDHLAGNVYWTDGFFDWIGMHPLKFDKDTSVFKIVKKGLQKPEGLALDAYDRILFWSDVKKDGRSVITRSDLAGNNEKNIVDNSDTNAIWITSLTVDTTSKKIYWSDMGRHTIEYSNYDGSMKGYLVQSIVNEFLSITASGSVVCGAEYYYGTVNCYDKFTKNETWYTSIGIFDFPWAVSVYDSDQQKVTTHPCQQKACKHMCINTGSNTATCACKEGYKLMGDGISCESEHGFLFASAIMIANQTDACMLDIKIAANHKQDPDCILSNLTNLEFFAVDSHERQFYYVDSSASAKSKIRGVDMLSNKESFSVDVGEDITGFTLDWTAKNVYWSETGGSISEYKIGSNGNFKKVISNEYEPSYVTVDPHLRKLYWLTYDSELVELNLDGTGRKVLLKNLYKPTALFHDVTTGRLFFQEFGDLSSIMPTDDPISVDFTTYIGDTKSLAVYKEYAYWENGVYLDMASIHSFSYDYDMDASYMNTVVAVGVYAPDIQPAEKGPCLYSNGGCEHFCDATGPTTRKCSCQTGYQLEPDGTSCSSEPFPDNFALLPDVNHHKIYQVSLSSGEARALDIADVDVPVSVIYDDAEKKVYWTNAIMQEIRSSPLKAEKSELILSFTKILPVGLAFDYSTNLLYFTSEAWIDPSSIGCLDPTFNMYKTLIDQNLDLPKNIALYPQKGWMVFTDISLSADKNSSIIFAHMDGTNVKRIVDDTNVMSPNGIVIDYQTGRIYWADAGQSSIESVLSDGSGRRQILAEAGAGLVGLDISGSYLYYVGRSKQQIGRYHLSTNQTRPFMGDIHALGRIESIRVNPGQTQPRSEACYQNKGGCELFCLPTPAGRSCGCPDGDSLEADGLDCKKHISCTRSIPNAQLDRKCLANGEGVCNFTCSNGYKKTVDKLTCDKNGVWKPSMFSACENEDGTCPTFFRHGHMSSNCNNKVGNSCTYVCNLGYIKDQNNLDVFCTQSGAWNIHTDNLCKPANVYCTNTIAHGKLKSPCTRGAGQACDYSCDAGYVKHASVRKIVCLNDGEWNFQGPLCVPESTQRCKSTLMNGQFNSGCLFRPKDACSYTCNSGYLKNTIVNQVTCMASGQWNYAVDKLCMKAMASCSKDLKNGQFAPGCSATSGAKCDYMCDTNFVQQPIALHVICYDGTWSSDPKQLCIEKSSSEPGVSLANQQKEDEGASGGTVALIVILAIVVTAIVVLGLVYVFWWKKRKPQGQYVQNNTNLKFQRFDDSGVPSEGGVTGFSNPIHGQQPDYGNFGTLREEGYITTEISQGYDQVDPKDVNVSVSRKSNPYDNTDA